MILPDLAVAPWCRLIKSGKPESMYADGEFDFFQKGSIDFVFWLVSHA